MYLYSYKFKLAESMESWRTPSFYVMGYALYKTN